MDKIQVIVQVINFCDEPFVITRIYSDYEAVSLLTNKITDGQ